MIVAFSYSDMYDPHVGLSVHALDQLAYVSFMNWLVTSTASQLFSLGLEEVTQHTGHLYMCPGVVGGMLQLE